MTFAYLCYCPVMVVVSLCNRYVADGSNGILIVINGPFVAFRRRAYWKFGWFACTEPL